MNKPAEASPLVYRTAKVRVLLGVSNSTIYRLTKAGELDLVKMGPRASAITRGSIARYAESRNIPLPSGF